MQKQYAHLHERMVHPVLCKDYWWRAHGDTRRFEDPQEVFYCAKGETTINSVSIVLNIPIYRVVLHQSARRLAGSFQNRSNVTEEWLYTRLQFYVWQ